MLLRYTTRTIKSRRLDSHQHGAVYGTAAFLNRATSAWVSRVALAPGVSRSARIRTLCGGFGDRLLSQEHAPKKETGDRRQETGLLSPASCLLSSGFFICGGRIRTGVVRLMRPCWKPDSSPLRSDQGESRTPMPVKARRSERRVSASSTTWPISSTE